MLNIRLKQLRKSKGLTQVEMAKHIDVARTTYAMYEQGKREPDYETLQRIANFHETTVDYLLGRTDKPTNKSLPETTEKDEKDIAKRLQNFKEEIENADGLAFSGEPLSDEAKESLIESMEYILRQTAKINKKYTPKKYRKGEQEQD